MKSAKLNLSKKYPDDLIEDIIFGRILEYQAPLVFFTSPSFAIDGLMQIN